MKNTVFPKFGSEKVLVRKQLGSERSWVRKGLGPKRFGAETSYFSGSERSWGRNVRYSKQHTDKIISLRSDEKKTTFYWSFKYISKYHLKWPLNHCICVNWFKFYTVYLIYVINCSVLSEPSLSVLKTRMEGLLANPYFTLLCNITVLSPMVPIYPNTCKRLRPWIITIHILCKFYQWTVMHVY